MKSADSTSAVVLAAGEGKRMRSPLPKVLHCVGGRPMIAHVLGAVAGLTPSPRPVAVVVGRAAEKVRAATLFHAPEALRSELVFAIQAVRLGTAHAVLQTSDLVAGRAAAVLVLYGDVPLLSTATLESLLAAHGANRPAITLLSSVVEDPAGYGRVIRRDGGGGEVACIVEDKVAMPAEREVREINAGVYVFDDAWLWPVLRTLSPAVTGEIYLTDLVACAVLQDRGVTAVVVPDPTEVAGVNTVAELAEAEAALRGSRG